MKLTMKQFNNKTMSKGQTLLEIIITITIIVLVLLGALGLVTQSLIVSTSSRTKAQAVFLAQEAMETVQNIRDTNWKKGLSWDSNFYTSDGWYKINFPYNSDNGWSLGFLNSAETSDPTTISLDGVTFTRSINTSKEGGANDKRRIKIKVTWEDKGTNKYETSEILTNWK